MFSDARRAGGIQRLEAATLPPGFGKVMSEVKPRLAVAFHTVLLPDIHQGMLEGIRKTYDGPLAIANDLMVWNVTKDSITMREASFPDRVTPPATTEGYKTAARSGGPRYPDTSTREAS